jgi:hypothetical protein
MQRNLGGFLAITNAQGWVCHGIALLGTVLYSGGVSNNATPFQYLVTEQYWG